MATKYPFIIINEDIPLKLEFPVNPTTIRFSSQKLYQETRTIAGYVYEHWGKQPTMIDVEGLMRKSIGNDFESEALWSRNFFALRQLYELDKRKMTSLLGTVVDSITRSQIQAGSANILKKLSSTIIYYKYAIYKGFFMRFDYRESGEFPWHIPYTFSFLSTFSSEDFLRDALLRLTEIPITKYEGGTVGTTLRFMIGSVSFFK